jgi:hypothetical protein
MVPWQQDLPAPRGYIDSLFHIFSILLRSGRTYIAGTIRQATVVATGASATTLVGVDLGAGLTVSGTSQTAIYSTNGKLAGLLCICLQVRCDGD